MPFYIYQHEHGNESIKQRINLSLECWRCIEDDVISFSTENEKLTKNGLLNRVIINYWENANATVSRRLNDTAKHISKSDLRRAEDAEAVREYLLKVRKAELLKAVSKPSKGKGDYFRLNKDALEILCEKCGEEKHYTSIGKYLHALYEEYAALSYSERERIVYGDKVAVINEAIEFGRKLEMKVGGGLYVMRPYKLLRGDANEFNYLVGFSSELGSDEETLVSNRLSRIYFLHRTSETNMITPSETSYIEEQISQKGVAFLKGKTESIRVRLTREGMKLFALRLTNRPVCRSKEPLPDGGAVYSFECTEFQAQNYFFSFGADAEILSPAKLRTKMKMSFNKASKLYGANSANAKRIKNK